MNEDDFSRLHEEVARILSGACYFCGTPVKWGEHRLAYGSRDQLVLACEDAVACGLKAAVRHGENP